jgi:hypothetical protein
MKTSIELPKAFSIRDDRELPLIRDLVQRLNPKLVVKLIATGMHVNGGSTVHWGVVYLDGQPLVEAEVRQALEDSGLDFQHNAEIQPARIWVGEGLD